MLSFNFFNRRMAIMREHGRVELKKIKKAVVGFEKNKIGNFDLRVVFNMMKINQFLQYKVIKYDIFIIFLLIANI
jgi:hypothetical protein